LSFLTLGFANVEFRTPAPIIGFKVFADQPSPETMLEANLESGKLFGTTALNMSANQKAKCLLDPS
jgi:hypothetical protein